MRKTIVAIILCGLLVPTTILAGSKHHGHHLDRLTEGLGLSEEQKGQIEIIFKEQHEKHKALREEGKERISAVLTPEQQEKFEAKREERMKHKRRHCSYHKRKGVDSAAE